MIPRTFEELERLDRDTPPAPRGRGTVRLVCVRKGGGVHAYPPRVVLTPEGGVDGDRWSAAPTADPEKQVTLMSARVAALVAGNGAPLGASGDNFVVDLELAEEALPAGTRLRLGSAILEVSAAPHTGCAKFRDRFGADALRWVSRDRARRLRGVNCRVVEAGEAAVGDAIEIVRSG